MPQYAHHWRHGIIIVGDIAVLYASLWLMLLVRYQQIPPWERWAQHVKPFTFVFLIYLISFAVVGLYQLSVARNSKTFYRAFSTAMFAATAVAAVFFYMVRPGITPRLNLLIFVTFAVLLTTLWRRLLNSILGSTLLIRTIILGYSLDAFELAKTLAHNPQLGYTLIAFVLNTSEASRQHALIADRIPVRVCSLPDILSLVRADRAELIIPATEAYFPGDLVKLLYAENKNRVRVADLPSIFESAMGKVPVQSVSELWFLEHAHTRAKPFYEIAKRAADGVLALIALIPAVLLSPFIYTAIKLDSKGSGFFMQHRAGKDGKLFLAIKFRSMHEGTGMKGPAFVSDHDPRVTRIGRFLRKTRLDELPQLVNILKGDMSFVGPRPEQPSLVESLSAAIPFYRERLAVKPGLTGWDQISGTYHSSSIADTLEKLQYDLYYIKNRSLLLDAIILLRTVKTVLSAQGK